MHQPYQRVHSMRYISLMDYERSKAWQVRLYQTPKAWRQGYFPFSHYGGKQKALKVAQQYRDKWEKEREKAFPEVNMALKNNQARSISRNSSGIMGVNLQTDMKGDRRHWRATLYRDGAYKLLEWYSIDRYGYTEAFLLAVRSRRRTEKKIFGKNAPMHLSKGHPLVRAGHYKATI